MVDRTWSTLLEKLHHVLDMISDDTIVLNSLRETPTATSVQNADIFSAQWFSRRKNLSELKHRASVQAGSRLPASSDTVDTNSGFLDTDSKTFGQTAWVVPVFVGKQILDFNVDTVTTISDLFYRKLCGANMSKANKTLYGPDNSKLDVLGQFTQILTYQR